MRSYNCTPVSYPSLPTCYHHPMWQAWDLALDHIVGQLPALLKGKATYEVSGGILPCQYYSQVISAYSPANSFLNS